MPSRNSSTRRWLQLGEMVGLKLLATHCMPASLLAISGLLTWRLFLLPVLSYWDHVPPPYGWGTLPVGWTDDLLGGVVWVNGVYWLLPFWLLSPAAVAKALLIVPAFVGPLAFLAFARRLGIGAVAGAVGALYYLLNPSVHGRYLQGHTGDIVAHALVPVFALAVWSLLGNQRRARMAAAAAVGLAFFLTGSLKPHWLVLQFGVVLPFVVGLFIAQSGWKATVSSLRWLAAGIVFGLLLSLPAIVIAATVGGEILERLHSLVHLRALSSSVWLSNAVRLAGEPSNDWLPRLGYYVLNPRGLLGFLPGLTILASLLLAAGSHRRQILLALAVFAVMISLALGTTYPISGYAWLFQHVPFFTAFRESSKFLLVGTFSAAVGLAVSVHAISARYPEKTRVALPAIVVAAILIYARPMIGGDLGLVRAGNHVPTAGALDIGRWLDQQPGDFRVMIIPHDDETFHLWPWVSRRPLFAVDNDRAFTSLASAYHAYSAAAFGRAQQDGQWAEMLARSAVRFVVVADREASSTFQFTSSAATLESLAARRLLETSSRFSRVFESGGYAVYENKDFRGWTWVDAAVTDDQTARARHCPPQGSSAMRPVRVVGDLGEWVDPQEVNATLGSKWIAGAAYEWVHPGPYARGESTHSRWYAITSGSAVMIRSVVISRAGDYSLSLRALLERGATPPALVVNGRRLAPRSDWPVGRFGNVDYGVASLPAGHHRVEVLSEAGVVAIDRIVLTNALTERTVSNDTNNHLGQNRTRPDAGYATPTTIRARRFLPGAYVVHFNSAAPGLITFSDARDPRWSVLSRGVRAEIVPCRGPLLHVLTAGGSGMIILWNRTAAAVSAAWLASGTAFLLGGVYVLRDQLRPRRA